MEALHLEPTQFRTCHFSCVEPRLGQTDNLLDFVECRGGRGLIGLGDHEPEVCPADREVQLPARVCNLGTGNCNAGIGRFDAVTAPAGSLDFLFESDDQSLTVPK